MKRRTTRVALIVALGAVLVSATAAVGGCAGRGAGGSAARVRGSGAAKTEARDVEAFHAVRLNGAADVNITVGGDRTRVTVTSDDNVLPVIETSVDGDGTLTIGTRESYASRLGVKVAILTPSLETFELNGSGDVSVQGLKGPTFSARIRGSGNLTARGTVEAVDASIDGSGDLRLADLKAKRAAVSIAGSGSAAVSAEDSITTSVSGSGDVRYRGTPPHVRSTVAGSGSVKQM